MSQPERVLVVDETSDTAEVLQAVLKPRGLFVNRIRPLEGPEVCSSNPPAVLVLDADSVETTAAGWAGFEHVPQVIIGTWQVPESAGETSSASRRYLQKPFQYAELIQAVEALIAHAPGC